MKKNREALRVIFICSIIFFLILFSIFLIQNRKRTVPELEETFQSEGMTETQEVDSFPGEDSEKVENENQTGEYVKEQTDDEEDESKSEIESQMAQEEQEYCLILIGDSRACSMFHSVSRFAEWNLIEDHRIAPDQGWVLFEKDNMKLAICEYGGGNLANGAYEKGLAWAKEVMEADSFPSDTKFCMFNFFGLGDVNTGFFPNSKGYYNEKGEEFAKGLAENCVYYQCTVGPIDENGTMGQAGVWTNQIIKDFNNKFKKTKHVKLYDLNAFLQKKGYACVISDTDPTGVHYQMETDKYILEEFVDIMLQS